MEENLNFAYGKLEELLEVHKDYPMTTNSVFIENSKKSRQDKRKEQLEDMMQKTLSKPGQKLDIEEITRLLSTMDSKTHLDMDMVAAEEAFDNMNAYYEVQSSPPIYLRLINLTHSGCDESLYRQCPNSRYTRTNYSTSSYDVLSENSVFHERRYSQANRVRDGRKSL